MTSMKLNYENIKKLYNENGNEILEILYYHYYFIVDKIYDRNNGQIDRKLLENCLRETINSYIIDGYKSFNPSNFIHVKMYKYEKKYILNKFNEYELINKAYSGDMDARYKLFLSFTSRIDEVAQIIYANIINNIANINYTLDDIKKVLYKDIWNLINRFYNRDNKGYNINISISVRLRDLSIRINKYVETKNIAAIELLKIDSKEDILEEKIKVSRRK